MSWWLAVFIAFSQSVWAVDTPSTASTLVEEVVSRHKDEPHHFDWRRDIATIEIGYSAVQEFNSFSSYSYNLGAWMPLGGPWIVRGAFRKVTTEQTASSRVLANTPFSQAAQPSRYEFLGGAGYAILDGRSATALSPKITDLGHALYATAGLQYSYFQTKDEEPLPAMRAIYYRMAAEVGLRLHIFLPHSLGAGLEWTYSRPLSGGDPDLNSWQRISGSVSWSFGQ